MPRTKLIKSWIEVGVGYMYDDPSKHDREDFEAYLFVANVEVRENAKGRRYLARKTGVKNITADTKEEMERKVEQFVLSDGVRLLENGLEPNKLPGRMNDPPDDVVAGSADIYQQFEEDVDRRLSQRPDDVARLWPSLAGPSSIDIVTHPCRSGLPFSVPPGRSVVTRSM